MTGFDPSDAGAASARIRELAEAGVTHLVFGARYDSADDFRRNAEAVAAAAG